MTAATPAARIAGAPLRLGTRASALATTQSQQVADRITELTGHPVELVHITTHGDVTRASLSSLGGTGVFATALRDALLNDECDLVVHSLKDLPTAPCPGLEISGIPLRADARDALCARDGFTLHSLPEGARVGTGSPRRIAQLYATRPDLDVIDIRGNIDTRLGRIEDDLDAVLLAAAGLNRLGRTDAITHLIDLAEWPTAPGQGALALETREGSDVSALLAALDDPHTRNSVTAERAVLNALEAGCAAPVGVSTLRTGKGHSVTAQVYSLDGMESLTVTRELPGVSSGQALLRYEELGRDIARELLDRGAATLAPLGR